MSHIADGLENGQPWASAAVPVHVLGGVIVNVVVRVVEMSGSTRAPSQVPALEAMASPTRPDPAATETTCVLVDGVVAFAQVNAWSIEASVVAVVANDPCSWYQLCSEAITVPSSWEASAFFTVRTTRW